MTCISVNECEHRGRIRPCCDCWCYHPNVGRGKLVKLSLCVDCPHAGDPVTPKRPGVGSTLSSLLLQRYESSVSADCNCGWRIEQMNSWGPIGCRENIDTIIGWLLDSAQALKKKKEASGEDVAWVLRFPQWAQAIGIQNLVFEAIAFVETWSPPNESVSS